MHPTYLVAFLRGFLIAFAGLLGSCGSGQKSESESSIANQVFDFTFQNGQSGDQFFIFPFITGDPSQVTGRTESHAGKFSIMARSARIEVDENLSIATTQSSLSSFINSDHWLRTQLNRLKASDLSFTQDGVVSSSFLDLNRHLTPSTLKSLHQPLKIPLKKDQSLAAQTGSCPSAIYVPTESSKALEATFDQINHESYCIVYYSNSGTSEPDRTLTEQSLSRILETFQLIFADDFATAARDGQFPFKPLIIVLPFENPEIWPSDLKVSGAFMSSFSERHLRPTIYLPTDLTQIAIPAESAKTTFHATLGHEMAHAVLNYYRVWVHGGDEPTPESVAIEEGIAHFMEDVFGYGEQQFATFAESFLTSWTKIHQSDISILDDIVSSIPSQSNFQRARGAAHTLIYFLVSQAGGLEFTDGTISGGGGLTFLRTFVAGPNSGPTGLANAMGVEWKTLVGNYFKALVVDNSILATLETSVQDPILTINNLQLEPNQTYGMNFTDYGNIPSLIELIQDENRFSEKQPEDLEDIEIHYYEPYPILVTIEGSDSSVTINFAEPYEGAHVVLVKVK